ncbi:type I secretion C-terminal target domain-containing protein [Enterovibrio coralii]|uniref:type I secretion C-terminal target domain-containing protein n=1 Tax=Enterovibrio coralii TaxID=294935 RepID=UPI0012F7F992
MGANNGSDALRGGEGDDKIFGRGGDDILRGGSGDDELYGGEGSDIFLWNKADIGQNQDNSINYDNIITDTVWDLSSEDTLDLSDLLVGISPDNLGTVLDIFVDDQNSDVTLKLNLDNDSDIEQSIVLKGAMTDSGIEINTLLDGNEVKLAVSSDGSTSIKQDGQNDILLEIHQD